MGTWGPGLYANDTARDLKPVVSTLIRLPFSADEIVAQLVRRNREVAEQIDNPGYASFWLVVADQLHRKGIPAPTVFERAIEIIVSGTDARVQAALGMEPSDLAARARALEALCKKLSRPQKLLMHAGDVMVAPLQDSLPHADGRRHPLSRYQVRNPYRRDEAFTPAGWTAFIVLSQIHAFGYLAVYCVMVLRGKRPLPQKPEVSFLASHGPWGIMLPGMCPRVHFQRMGLERVGRVSLCEGRVQDGAAATLTLMEHFAVSDVSLSNRLTLDAGLDRPDGRVAGLSVMCSSP